MSEPKRCVITQISKSFPSVKALDNISFDVNPGEIHALIGENGAGKSTLMNILSGVYTSDSGQIEFDGSVVEFTSPRDAQKVGISMIHQELSLFKVMTIYENIFIERMPKKRSGVIDCAAMINQSREYLKMLGVSNLDPKELVKHLSVAQMQLIEIAKAISMNAKLLIMDEPTSSLTAGEIEQVLQIMRSLRSQGVSILFITHKLEEVMNVADRITVLRDGQMIRTLKTSETEIPQLVSLMVGRDFRKAAKRAFITEFDKREVVMEVKHLSVPGKISDISFKLYRGEVLGLTGLVGAGRTELLQAIFGMYPTVTGEIIIKGNHVTISHPDQAVLNGIGLVPEGRKEQGMFLKLDVLENMTTVYRRKVSKRQAGIIPRKELEQKAQQYVEYLGIKTPSLSQISTFLSGGNQQKTIIARWLMNDPEIMLLDEPTHGIDIGAKAEIYAIIDKLVLSGMSVILLSSELPEILGLCDRVMVMYRGKLTAILDHTQANEVSIMNHAFNQV